MALFKSWNGSSWITHGGWLVPKVWNGSAWVEFRPRIWTGAGWGVVSVPQTRTVTVGSVFYPADKFMPDTTLYGYSQGSFGSMNSTSLQLWENGVIGALYWHSSNQILVLSVDTIEPSNSGFATLKVGSTSFSRASAYNYNNGGTYHSWSWSVTTNPFTAVGTNTTVTWT